MKRTIRPPFDFDMTAFQEMHAEAQNQLLFDWWCDEDDRAKLIAALNGKPLKFHTRAPRQDDPAPPLTEPAPQGFRDAWIISSPKDIDRALTHADEFSNIPYAALGGGGFLLAQDPSQDDLRHAQQVEFVKAALKPYTDCAPALRKLATLAVSQAALTTLASPNFDVAALAEQAGLRYLGLLFGYGFQDHLLLEGASRTAYRALQYIAIGQHFATEPGTVPAAQQMVGQLVARTSELSDEYARLKRSPHRFGTLDSRYWPQGVQPWCELDLTELGQPLLKGINTLDSPLSGRDRAIVCSMLLSGTIGNIQSAACLLIQDFWSSRDDEWAGAAQMADGALEDALDVRLCKLRPLPVLPRRALTDLDLASGAKIRKGDDCLLALEGGARPLDVQQAASCPHVWGEASQGSALHSCLGKALARPLMAAIVRHTLNLPGLTQALDPLTGEALDPERLWGFACTRYPMRYDRQRAGIQQNLIVSMRIKAPIAQNFERLSQLLASSVPRVADVLTDFEGVHFAWFEFSDDGTRLVLRTIYDGQFEAYVRHFALRSGDLFDGLFEFLEDAPPRPVAEHPDDFVETIRRFNLAPLAGYLYSAYPEVTVAQVRQAGAKR